MMIILVVVLIFFGGEKLPEFARGFGKVMREVRKAAGEVEHEIKKVMEEAEQTPIQPPASRLVAPRLQSTGPAPTPRSVTSLPPPVLPSEGDNPDRPIDI